MASGEAVKQETSGLAIASLVLGIVAIALCFGPLTGIPALILGIIAISQMGKSEGRLGGKGLAIAGIERIARTGSSSMRRKATTLPTASTSFSSTVASSGLTWRH